MSKISRDTIQARDGQAIVGIQKNLQKTPDLPLAGSVYSMAALMKLVQSRIDAANVVATSRAAWLHDAATYQALHGTVTPVLRALRQYLNNVHGPDSPIMADFGFAPPKKAQLTAEQLVTRSKKAAATRKARGTMGAKQRLR